MPLKRLVSSMTCVDAAYQRILNVFSNGVKVYMSLSGGKDSICMAHIVYSLIQQGKINAEQLTCVFIDEEAIYDSSIQAMKEWRKRFILAGAKFNWYCLPLKQVSCMNQLTNDESWITWEPGKEDVWVRKPPPFAITYSPYLTQIGQMNYQTFLPKVCKDGIMLVGVRAAESVQRLKYLSGLNVGKQGITGNNLIYPIYDWKDSDIWLYIKNNHIDFPDAYIHIYQAGESKRSLRISNFFACDSLRGLKNLAETDPQLWEHIEKREPNAYLVMLYWDTEWYKRNSRTRKKNEKQENIDYKLLVKKMLFEDFDKHFTNKTTRSVAKTYKRFYVKVDGIAQDNHYRMMYDALIAGDPKRRTIRAIFQNVFNAYADYSRQFRVNGGENNG